MKRILVTGMSGTGKSSVARALVTLGYQAIDTDDGWCEPRPDGRQRWREEAIQGLLETADGDVLFVAGCEENMVAFLPRFDNVVLLSAPVETLVERIADRTDNPFGKQPGELQRVCADVEQVEPLLRRIADLEVDATRPLAEVVAAVVRIAEP